MVALATGLVIEDFDFSARGGLLWLGLVASTGAFLRLNFGVRGGVVARFAFDLMVTPLAAAVLGWVFFRINLTPFQWRGALTLTGIAVTTDAKGISWRIGSRP